MFFDRITYCNRRPFRTRISNNNLSPEFHYFYPIANFPLTTTVKITLKFYSSLNFTRVYTLPSLNMVAHHLSILMHSTNETAVINACHIITARSKWKTARSKLVTNLTKRNIKVLCSLYNWIKITYAIMRLSIYLYQFQNLGKFNSYELTRGKHS
jgi:hypothetical protein